MLGSFRFLLAAFVALSHLSGEKSLFHFGIYAVRSFYVISGFVTAAALHETYGFRFAPFWINRMLRLLPPYLLLCLLTAALILILPDQARMYEPTWDLAEAPRHLLGDFTLLPIELVQRVHLVPPAWSLSVELAMYIVLWAVVARSRGLAWAGLLIGIGFHAGCSLRGLAWGARHFTIASGLMSYSLGALAYLYRGNLAGWTKRLAASPILLAWAMNLILAGWLFTSDGYVFGLGFYINLGLSFILIGKLAKRRPEGLDKAFGDLAYPMFLTHWLAGFLVLLVMPIHQTRGWDLFGPAFALSLGAAWGLIILSRAFVEPLRSRVRNRGAESPASSPQRAADLGSEDIGLRTAA